MYPYVENNMYEMKTIRRNIQLWMLALLSLPLSAQEKTDSMFCFRFVPEKDMFFIPYGENGREFTRLLECVERYREEITDNGIPLYVDGYCSSTESEAENLIIARTRANRVKSELIVRKQLKEACFVTRNHASGGDSVTVRIIMLKTDRRPMEKEPSEKMEKAETVPAEKVEEAETSSVANKSSEIQETSIKEEHLAEMSVDPADSYCFTLRANLIRWATLTPDLGIEWRVNPSWGIVVNGSWTSWTWNDKDRRYALWEVSPEVRYYIGKEKRGYIGAMYKAGQFNYKFSATGKQGDLMGGGIVGGYQLRLNNALSLDFNLGIGCVHADYEKYEVIDGVRVCRGTESKNWWGPVNAGIILVWKLF